MSVTEIDGSILEGGGQIIRLAIALTTLLKKPIKVTKIRANRAKGGLRPQHLKGLELAAKMCNGTLSGAVINSTEITYYPGNLNPGRFVVDTETAGSIALLMQVGIPIALFACLYAKSQTSFLLKGGTNADMAPPVDYMINVFLPLLRKFGGEYDCKIKKRGYYPKGGGIVEVQISPVTTLSPVSITLFGTVTRIWGRSYVAGVLPVKMAHEMADAAEEVFSKLSLSGTSVNIERVKESPEEAFGSGSGIVLFAETNTGCILGGSALGKRGLPSREVGIQAAEKLAVPLKGQFCVDDYMQDQIIILMALADGKSVVRCGPVTEHTKTAIYIAETLTNVKFKIEEELDFTLLECDGIGFKRS